MANRSYIRFVRYNSTDSDICAVAKVYSTLLPTSGDGVDTGDRRRIASLDEHEPC
ncbi:MAG: hypothetical protein GX216_05400 [Methanomicrobiales archaeon]|nr:hypothetical protein [Methanomicrobiales archaeon]